MINFLDKSTFDERKNKNALKNILAVLMITVVNADEKSTIKEQNKVLEFYQNEFNMNKEETINFFNSVKHENRDVVVALENLKELFASDVQTKAKVLHHLNSLIICDGCEDVEYDIFEQIREYLA